jgi:hypothetical protein
MPLCQICSTRFPNRVRIDGKLKSLQNRKFCLACSPYGQHNTKSLSMMLMPEGVRRCPRCQQMLSLDRFYRRRDGRNASVYCKECTNRQAIERQQRLKQDVVAFLGGCCAHCGYDRYIGSLEVHHTDPTVKEFDLSHCRSTTFEKIKPELDKCLLLCANCHREEHARLKGLL